VAVTGDGRAVSASDDRTLRVWDLHRGTCARTLRGHTGQVNAVAVTADGRAVSGGHNGTLRIWDLGSGAWTLALRGHTGPVNAVAVTGDSRAISTSDDRTLRVWDLMAGRCLAVFPCEAPVLSVAVTSGRTPTVVAGLADGQVQFFRLEEA
jgi:WD40 repeat protein